MEHQTKPCAAASVEAVTELRANRSQRRSMTLICRTAVLCRSPLNQQEPLAAAGVLFRRNRVPRHACGFDTLCLTVTLRLRQRHSLFPWRPSKEPVMRTADYTAIYAVPRNFLRAPPPFYRSEGMLLDIGACLVAVCLHVLACSDGCARHSTTSC